MRDVPAHLGRQASASWRRLAALVVFGLALLIAANALTAQAASTRRLAARGELLRTCEIVMESLRGGMLPLVSGPVRLDRDLDPSGDVEVYSFVRVDPRCPPRTCTR